MAATASGQCYQLRDIGLVGLITVLMLWPDVTMPVGYVLGVPSVGYGEPCGVFPTKPAQRVSFSQVLEDGPADAGRMLASMRPGPHDEFLTASAQEDVERGFCSCVMTVMSKPELEARLKGRPFRLIRRFCIEQASGNKRSNR